MATVVADAVDTLNSSDRVVSWALVPRANLEVAVAGWWVGRVAMRRNGGEGGVCGCDEQGG